ncbi:histidine kinase [Agromyces intestinalis]|uniref:Histidine kinase n=1 Tax=Agromyces intestinalis TaxID=2592652 RepID=A0A5C1YD51_9MICO|nr:ATP-binding protein [Agromyces intestinalis]QEO13470.1 histidine kinase [Agromyces intestinalis]
MKRIQKERDRLLRRVARVAGITGAAGALAGLIVPGTAPVAAQAVGAVLLIALCALLVFATRRGGLVPLLGVVALALAVVVVIAPEQTADPVASTVAAAVGAVAAASAAIMLIVRPRGGWIVVGTLAVVLAVYAGLALVGRPTGAAVLAVAVGWLAAASLGRWLDLAIARTGERIEEVGRAHQAERMASELAAQRRQDARVLHDTVLATLSLLAHSGVGVGTAALRQQASDDARLLRMLRLGAPLDGGTSTIFSPDAEVGSLSTTFESVRQRFSRMGLDVSWHGTGQLALPRDTLDALVGALGECLENVRRHSGVAEADVTVTDDDRTVRAMVTDSGAGFEPGEVDRARLGFAESVVGRLDAVGGRARVFSSPGAGTTVMLEVPKP